VTYYYLASPYTHADEQVMQQRFEAAERCLHWLLQKQIWTYSPIVHCHALAKRYGLPKDHLFWKTYDRAMIVPSRGILVLMIDGWKTSSGVTDEIVYAEQINVSVETIEPAGDEYRIAAYRPCTLSSTGTCIAPDACICRELTKLAAFNEVVKNAVR